MAEDADQEEKTEEPTQRKLDQAHEQGDVVKSQEVATFFTLAAVTLVVSIGGAPTISMLLDPLRGLIEHADTIAMDSGGLRRLWLTVMALMGLGIAIPVITMMIAGVAGHLIQHRFVFSSQSIQPKLSKISPLAGFKRLVSPEALANFVKGLIKIAIVGASMLYVLWPQHERVVGMISLDLGALVLLAQDISVDMLIAMLSAMFLVAGIDYLWVRHRWMQRQRMTLKEVKDDFRQSDGNPEIKGKIRQIRTERARKRMMSAVPQATVVITNPTHYAVALKYDSGMQAPVCVAKGVDAVALRIRELAKANNVTIVENPPLARTLYATVDIDAMIPEQHYRAVAEVIGYVMTLKSRKSWRS